MRRHPAVDPPEYLEWRADPALIAEYATRAAEDEERRRLVAALDEAARLRLYAGMVRFRLHDYTLKRWVRQGVISKAWLGTGEEAVTIGAVHALEAGVDYVAPMIRNQGALHEFGMPLESLFAGYLATADSPTGGRDGHIGDLARGVIAPISHVGDMVPVTAGVALAFKQRGEARVALTWIGDGTTKAGASHEGLNLAAALQVPAIFVIQNNQVALGTSLAQHHRGDFLAWGAAYGMDCVAVDGNNVLAVYGAVRRAAELARGGAGAGESGHAASGRLHSGAESPARQAGAGESGHAASGRLRSGAESHSRRGPFLIVAETFRMGGHATHDEAEARRTFAAELFTHWGARDPIGLYEEHLAATGIERARLEQVEADVAAEVEAAAERALAGRTERAPAPATAEYEGVSAGVRQPGLAERLRG